MPASDGDGEFDEWFERRNKLADALNKELTVLRASTDSDDVNRTGRLLTAGASLLDKENEMNCNVQVGSRLFALRDHADALSFFDLAETLYDQLEAPDKKYPL